MFGFAENPTLSPEWCDVDMKQVAACWTEVKEK